MPLPMRPGRVTHARVGQEQHVPSAAHRAVHARFRKLGLMLQLPLLSAVPVVKVEYVEPAGGPGRHADQLGSFAGEDFANDVRVDRSVQEAVGDDRAFRRVAGKHGPAGGG